MLVEASRPDDRQPILAVTRGVGVFDAEEVGAVAELFDGYQRGPQVSGYNFLSCRASEHGPLLGFACWGPASLSKGAADLYWIATDPAAQGQGAAGALFAAVEAAVRAAGRWLIVIWTSSLPNYAPARGFYLSRGCQLALQLAEFYDRGDDLCMFVRRL